MGKKRSVTKPTSIITPIKWDAVYLNKKIDNGLRKILKETKSIKEMLKMRQCG
jgi:hypothetical protein